MKIILNTIGTLCLVLGILGIILPLLPTTPFLLLAAACYLRSSDRLHKWLMNNRYLGPYIKNIKDKRGMPLKAKIYTIALLWGSLLFSIYKTDKIVAEFILVIIGATTTAFILKLRTLTE